MKTRPGKRAPGPGARPGRKDGGPAGRAADGATGRTNGASAAGSPSPAAGSGRAPTPPPARLEAGPEQLRYATVLEKGMLLGLALLLLTYFVYLSGLLKPFVPLAELPRLWHSEVGHYLHETGIGTGWGWVGLLGHGDFLNFLGIALLAGVSIFCYAAVLPVFWRKGDRAYFLLALAQILILCVAASGILGSGGGH